MIFNPQNLTKKEGSFIFSGEIKASAHPCLNKDIFKEFWHNFTFQSSELNVDVTDRYIFSVGNAEQISPEDCDYTINIEKTGFSVCAKSEKKLIQGFMTLLDRFKAIDCDEKTAIEAECCQIKDSACLKTRMIHYCIFPETELWELKRFVRFCGALKYTHVILEFWGMLKYDCLKELSWSHGFTKDEIRPIIREANELGLEIIPMFNHWGHASAGRVIHGKHVVLDQNPSLQTYFSEDGWCWDISKPKVRALLRSIRVELIELCGDSSYFHVGCDEAYNFEFTKENMDFICDFLNEICAEMKDKNCRIIAWGDMFLYRYDSYDPANKYTCNAPSPEVEKYLLNRLDKNIIIADWQYDARTAPIETAAVFRDAGFDCVLCPWDRGVAETRAALATVEREGLMGFMHTTWHTLTAGMPYVFMMAQDAASYPFEWASASTAAASLLRKVLPACGVYERAGWSKIQVHSRW